MAIEQHYVYSFREGYAEGNRGMKALLGSKGANLAEMAALGLPVPGGFTISTEVTRQLMRPGEPIPEELAKQVSRAITVLEEHTGLGFGDVQNPLLLSVRSGAAISMPGMMDTILNIGLNEKTIHGLIERSGDARFAYDCYRRFLQMYSHVVMGLDSEILETLLADYKHSHGLRTDLEITAVQWMDLIEKFAGQIEAHAGQRVPEEPHEQIWSAIRAVFQSWNTPRAVAYRKHHGISSALGTAVNVQCMVFGNIGESSASGVAFTRNPATGEKAPFGEFLAQAQGEDVVAGIRTPAPLNEKSRPAGNTLKSLEQNMPEQYQALVEHFDTLEEHYRDVQDVEFTIEQQKVWILQTRTGKRSGVAAVKTSLDMLDEGMIDEKEALLRIDAKHHIAELLHPRIDPKASLPAPITTGLAASPGAAVGELVLSPDEAVRRAKDGRKVILVRRATSADDVHGLQVARGVLTQTGGLTSHAAVVARSLGVPCVTGAESIHILPDNSGLTVGKHTFKEGETLTVDGTNGKVYAGALVLIEPELSGEFERLMNIANQHSRLEVRANADTPDDARRALAFGAQGIGLCRTEHMFFSSDERLSAMRAAIMAEDINERQRALEQLLPFQREDFEAILYEMNGHPVTVRLLDPPLHEFLPEDERSLNKLAKVLGKSTEYIYSRAEELRETNPMLGNRGCRIGITHPEIYLMQVRALFEAAARVHSRGVRPHLEIMIPLVIDAMELKYLRELLSQNLDLWFEALNLDIPYAIGTMIELPRAALTADKIAEFADFFSFGTNDLTQATLGLSRDDSAAFLPFYLDERILPEDPFVSIDESGVGELMSIARKRGLRANPSLSLGICGEHGGDPKSIAFCHKLNLDYVSCSPFRVPAARIAAAQAAVRGRR